MILLASLGDVYFFLFEKRNRIGPGEYIDLIDAMCTKEKGVS